MKKLTLKSSNKHPVPGGCHVTSALAAALSLAALSNQSNEPLGIAACSFEIQLDQPWQQILPHADFSAYDGRPFEVPGNKWKIDDVSGAALATRLNDRAKAGQRLLIDYDHQTLLTKENGQKAPASAWGEKFEWRQGQGLFAQLKFTPAAREHIKNDEYKYYSPVVMYNKKTGQVFDLHSAALTNDPAIKGMAEAAALHTKFNQPTEPKPMNEALAMLFGLLGMKVDTKQDIDAAALHSLLTDTDGKKAVAALKAKLDADEGDDDSAAQIAALTAQLEQAGKTDLSKFVPVETYSAVVTELAALKADHESVTVDQVIEQAQKDGKFIAQAELSYLKDLGNSDMAALKSILDGRPAIAALSGKQTKSDAKPDDKDKTGVAALTADQKLVADQLAISHEDYAAELAKEK